MITDTANDGTAREGRTRPRVRNVGVTIERAAVPAFLVLLVIFFSVNPATGALFLGSANIQNILSNYSVTGLIALGMIVPMVAGSFDVSVAAIAGVSNVVMASLLATYQQPVAVGVIAGIISGLLVGAINGVLIAVIRLNPFITTLGMYIFIGGLLQLYTGGYTISNGFPADVGLWGSAKWLGLARPFWILMTVAVAMWFVLSQTPFGRKLAAIGSSESAARLAGIRVDRSIFITFLVSGLLGGMAGVLLTIRSSIGGADLATSYLFAALAAVFLGQTAINPGHYNVWGTIIGVYVVAVAVDGFSLMGAASWVTSVFNGAALVLSVAVSTLLAQARERRARAAQLDAIRSG